MHTKEMQCLWIQNNINSTSQIKSILLLLDTRQQKRVKIPCRHRGHADTRYIIWGSFKRITGSANQYQCKYSSGRTISNIRAGCQMMTLNIKVGQTLFLIGKFLVQCQTINPSAVKWIPRYTFCDNIEILVQILNKLLCRKDWPFDRQDPGNCSGFK